MSVNTQPQPHAETCAKCGQREGSIYEFFYGKTRTHTMTYRGNMRVHKIRTSIDGVGKGVACDQCIRSRRINRVVVFLVLLVVGAGISLLAGSLETYIPILNISTRQLRPMMVG